MILKTTVFILIVGVVCVLYAAFLPIGTRSAQRDIKGGDEWVIAVSRPHYIFPREYLSRGGPNPFNFWSYAPDPYFDASKIGDFEFTDLDGKSKPAAIQGFHINMTYSNLDHREDVAAVRVGQEVFDFPTPEFQYLVGSGLYVKFHFLGQEGPHLFFYYPKAKNDRGFVQENGKFVEGIVKITYPFSSGEIEIVKSDDVENWNNWLNTLDTIDLAPSAFESLCNGVRKESRSFAFTVFGKNCG